jgi:metal-responsive CopG/Arc/MetJ family transcriptional regulator
MTHDETLPGEPVTVLLPAPLLADLDAWIAKQDGLVDRSGAVRAMVGAALYLLPDLRLY